jgi:type IV pilus assembly protein PilX
MSINKIKNLSGHHTFKQQGVVLFIALVALVVMSLAAVALIRSVDTNTLIGGNLSFKQAATTSADAGIEAAITQLIGMRDAVGNNAKNVLNDATHTMNNTDLTARPGYHSSVAANLATDAQLSADATWDGNNHVSLAPDASGNTVRYIIQRMCRTPNVAIQNANCLFSTGAEDKNGQEVPLPQNVCFGPGCPVAGQTPRIRVTVRVEGPKNAISYVQAFVH